MSKHQILRTEQFAQEVPMDLEVNTPKMLFIVGRGRSGTTLLRSILDMHPKLSIAPESLFMMNTYSKYKKKPWEDIDVINFANDLFKESRFPAWGLNQRSIEQELLKCDRRTFSILCSKVYSIYALSKNKSGVAYVGDKNPHYALFIPLLKKLFPDSKFLHITRDYRDNILSYQSMRFDINSVPALAFRWNIYNEKIISAFSERDPSYLHIRFEDVVSFPQETLKQICSFLGIDFVQEMLDFYKKNDMAKKKEWHRKLRTPLDPKQLDKWRERMKAGDLELAEKICGDYAQNFGYHKTLNKRKRQKSAARIFLAKLHAEYYTKLEESLFLLPLPIRSWIITTYRKMTGSA